MLRLSRGRRIAVVAFAAFIALVLLWDWNWFRPLVAAQLSAALGREVQLAHFDAHLLRRRPEVQLDGLAIGNPRGFPAASRMAEVAVLRIAIEPRALWRHALHLVEIDIESLRADLGTDQQGRPNWQFGDSPPPDRPPPKPSRWTLAIGELRIHDGRIHVRYPQPDADFELQLHTEHEDDPQQARVVVGAQGRYAGQPIEARLRGGAILSLRDANTPYPVDFELRNGRSHLQAQGTLQDPLQFAGADVRMRFEGADMADLYPLTAVPFPHTPPFRVDGRLDYAEGAIRFHDFDGSVGSSDLSGTLAVTPSRPRPLVQGRLRSRKVVLADLAGFIGAEPGSSDVPQPARTQAADKARPRLLPDTPLSFPKVRGSDVHIEYRAEHIQRQHNPLDRLEARLAIDDGRLRLQPLSFGIGPGSIVADIDLDATQDPARLRADVDFRQLDLAHLLQRQTPFKGQGRIGGEAQLAGRGNSLAQLLAHGDGELKLYSNGGDISALLVDLAGLDFGNGALSALGIPSRAQLRCMATQFALADGQLHTQLFVFDTTEANVVGSGTADLRDETLDFRLATEPKHFNIGSIPAPILVRGPLRSPAILPDPATLAARGGAAALFGAVLTPLAALIPTIQLGLGKDKDCDALLRAMQSRAPG